ncbi:type II and III secretion system protein [Mariniblastus sp.]|nr:type II and III secretion system protein [Mariniblastus sp.]MDB2526656.1 type II and III secretion system protein [Mariniblastus sp.]
MFKMFVCFCVALCAIESTFAQESTNSANVSNIPASYIVQLTEYRLDQPLNPSQSAAEILAMVSANGGDMKGEIVETIRLSTLSGTESMVQFGRRVNVTVGKATTNRGETVRNMQAIDVGTIVKVTLVPRNDKVAMMLTFESSRIGEDADEDSPPNVNKTQVNTTQLLELGKPDLVGSSTTSSSSIIVVTVTHN